MHNLSIDIGNSSTKIAVFEGLKIVHYQRFSVFGVAELVHLINKFEVKKSIISTVDVEISALEGFLKLNTDYIRFSTQLNKGIQNKYKTPQTLGLDRWAAVIGAQCRFNGVPSLIVDAGTCITYDFLNSKSEYFGGSISPGIQMRFKAMNQYTERLPLVSWSAEDEIPQGTDTTTAIKNGVLQGIINEIEGYIAIYNNKTSALNVILTGGDADFLFKQLQNSIFAPQIVEDPYLVLKGLNEVIA